MDDALSVIARAEYQLVGSLFLAEPDLCAKLLSDVRCDDLLEPALRAIVRAMKECEEASSPISVFTVAAKLGTALDRMGGLAWLEALAQRADPKVPPEAALQIVVEASMQRRLLALLSQVHDEVDTGGRVIGDAIRMLYEGLDLIESQTPAERAGQLESLEMCTSNAIGVIEAASDLADPDGVTGIRTGLPSLDRELGGLQRGDLIILAGRPSQGKTALAMNIADHVGKVEKLPVVVFSLEMGGAQLAMRLIASETGIDQKRLRSGQVEQSDWARIVDVLESLKDVKSWIDSSTVVTVGQMRGKLRKLVRTVGRLGLIVIDYMQLVSGTETEKENRAVVVSAISRGLKRLAKEFDAPVIALSQLTRTVDARPDKRPIMSDLRESGSLEQDADVLLFIYRDEAYHPDTRHPGEAELIIGKQRNGPIGMVRLGFDKSTTRFRELVT